MEFFRKHLGLIATLTVICLVIVGVLYYMQGRSYQGSFEEKFRDRQAKAQALRAQTDSSPMGQAPSSTQSITANPIDQLASPPEKLHNFTEKWKESRQILLEAKMKCQAAEERALPDNTLIDVSDPFYEVPDRVLAKYVEVLEEALFAEGAFHASTLWEEALNSDVPMRYDDYLAYMEEFNICKGQRSLVFIDTVLESVGKGMWTAEKKKDLLRMTLGHLEVLLESNPATTQNLALTLNILINLSAQKLVGRESFSDLEDLHEKVLEAEDLGREMRRMDRTDVVKREFLRDHWRNNKYLASEITELLKRLRRESL